ncbi:MAG TPA: SDR family oxidoreductase [Pirellulales bacterium]|jgi:NAD(P)-dependent dehydrogenase (short-subunit alcohol dehydrogenase family)|nr:SDR family oxidoreductase [Pirellulales bacterium]
MDLQLAGEVAVVVGAAKGIGRAIAGAFGSEGASVGLIDREAAVADAARDIEAAVGRPNFSVTADVTDYDAICAAAKSVCDRFGRCDHVVYAAGRGSGKFGHPFWNLEPADWEPVLRVNLVGAVNVAHAFAPTMVAARRGTFLFIASIAGQIGSQTDPPYSAAKAGLINFAQCAAKDLAAFEVRVNCLSPGMVKTELNRSVWQAWNARQPPELQRSYEEWTDEKIRRTVPLGRWQEVDDMAAAAVFLASARARNITGQTLNVDGGQVMHS